MGIDFEYDYECRCSVNHWHMYRNLNPKNELFKTYYSAVLIGCMDYRVFLFVQTLRNFFTDLLFAHSSLFLNLRTLPSKVLSKDLHSYLLAIPRINHTGRKLAPVEYQIQCLRPKYVHRLPLYQWTLNPGRGVYRSGTFVRRLRL